MIHEFAIWKLVLAGFILALFSFIAGFLTVALCVASGRASREEERDEDAIILIRYYMKRIDESHQKAQQKQGGVS